ncbi:hypothetical protein BH09VER1_BH09VER1_22040 [soil metagenome]
MITHRAAELKDASLLGELNKELIEDEGHRNPMSVEELAARMVDWLAADYRALIFLKDGKEAAYGLYRIEKDHVYLRQFFVRRHLRRTGIGRECMRRFLADIGANARIVVEVLAQNAAGAAFWRAVGFADYSLALEHFPKG